MDRNNNPLLSQRHSSHRPNNIKLWEMGAMGGTRQMWERLREEAGEKMIETEAFHVVSSPKEDTNRGGLGGV
jgi:hypothetical protein